MVTEKVMQTLNLLILSTAKKTGHDKANCFVSNRRNEANENCNNNGLETLELHVTIVTMIKACLMSEIFLGELQ
jgi:hypothetical protein